MATKKDRSLSRLVKNLMTDVPSGGVRYETVRSEEKKPFPVTFVIVALLITAMLMLVVFSFVRITRVRSEIARVQKQLSDIEEEIGERQRDLDEKYRDIDLEKRAAELGMTDGRNTRYLPRESEKEVAFVLGRDKPKNENALLSVIGRSFQALINFIN